MEKEKCLKVQMLGDFIMTYQGKVISLGKSQTTKVLQLLQLDIKSGPLLHRGLQKRKKSLHHLKAAAPDQFVKLRHLQRGLHGLIPFPFFLMYASDKQAMPVRRGDFGRRAGKGRPQAPGRCIE